MIKRFFYRSPGAEGGGAGPTLEELENEDDDSQDNPNDDKGNLEDFDQDAEDKDDDKKDDDPDEDDKEADKTEKDKADSKDKNDKPDDEEDKDSDDKDDTSHEDFYAEVNTARGIEDLEVDYGTTDPLSPAGVAIRENAVYDKAQEEFETHLETKFPKAYAYFAHIAAGRPEEDFFGNASDLETLPTEDELMASSEVQKDMVFKNLIAKGNSEKHANKLVQLAIEDSELEEMAKAALKEREAAKQAKLDDVKQANEDAIAQKSQAISKLSTVVDNVVATGTIGTINIPEKDRKPFAEALKKSVRYDNGKFMLVSELTDESMAELFSKEYFAFKKGNLGQLVQTAAKTENAKRLKMTLPKEDAPKARSQKKVEIVSLSDIDADD